MEREKEIQIIKKLDHFSKKELKEIIICFIDSTNTIEQFEDDLNEYLNEYLKE